MGDATTAKETVQKATGLYSAVMGAGTNYGRSKAEQGMSPESIALTKFLGHVKADSAGDDVADCTAKALTATLSGNLSGQVCNPDAVAIAKETGGRVLSRIFDKAKAGPGYVLNTVFDAGAQYIETQQNHKDSIRLLAQQGFPGMSYEEHIRDGNKVKVWGDALGAGLHADNPQVKTYLEVESLSGDTQGAEQFQSKHWREMQALEKAGGNKALESVFDYAGNKGFDALKEKVQEAPDELRTAYSDELAANQAYRERIKQGPAVSGPESPAYSR